MLLSSCRKIWLKSEISHLKKKVKQTEDELWKSDVKNDSRRMRDNPSVMNGHKENIATLKRLEDILAGGNV